MRKKIELIIVGAQKAGTTSLNRYLSQHPKIYTHFTQEFGMFRDFDDYNKGFDYYYKNTVSDKVKSDPSKSIFVAKRVGLMYNPELLLKLKEHNPDVKIIVVLRNPIERAFSAFWYCVNNGVEPYKQFEDAIFTNDPARFNGNEKLKKNCEYISRSSYLNHLKKLYSIFPPQNIKIFLFEEMISDLNKYLNEMCNFINAEEYEFDTSIKYNEKTQSKFPLLSKLLSPAKNKIFGYMLPMKQRIKLKQTLKGANAKGNKNENKNKITTDTRAYLRNIFKQDLPDLENFTQLPLSKYWQEYFS